MSWGRRGQCQKKSRSRHLLIPLTSSCPIWASGNFNTGSGRASKTNQSVAQQIRCCGAAQGTGQGTGQTKARHGEQVVQEVSPKVISALTRCGGTSGTSTGCSAEAGNTWKRQPKVQGLLVWKVPSRSSQPAGEYSTREVKSAGSPVHQLLDKSTGGHQSIQQLRK